MFGLELMIMLAIAVAAYMAWNIGATTSPTPWVPASGVGH